MPEPSLTNKIAVATFAADWYRSYIPLFLYCLFKVYPDYEAIIFLRKPLGHVEKPGLKLIWGNVEFIIVDGFPKLKNRAQRVKLFQTARFLVLTPKNLEKFASRYDYIYLTDVDILFMPERVPLHEQHLRHCETLGLPYSNFVRNTEPPRLTGLHFASMDFYKKVAPIVQRYNDMVMMSGIPDGYGRCPDEAIWYRIVQEAGFPLPPKCTLSEQDTWQSVFDPNGYNNTWFGPHHGVHVGFGRAMNRFRGIFETEHYKRYMVSLRKLMEDATFGKLRERLHPRAKAALKNILSV